MPRHLETGFYPRKHSFRRLGSRREDRWRKKSPGGQQWRRGMIDVGEQGGASVARPRVCRRDATRLTWALSRYRLLSYARNYACLLEEMRIQRRGIFGGTVLFKKEDTQRGGVLC